MSTTQFIVALSTAAAAIIPHLPLARALSAAAPTDSTDGYPPPSGHSRYEVYEGFAVCSYSDGPEAGRWEERKALEILVNVSMTHTYSIRCPTTASRTSFDASYAVSPVVLRLRRGNGERMKFFQDSSPTDPLLKLETWRIHAGILQLLVNRGKPGIGSTVYETNPRPRRECDNMLLAKTELKNLCGVALEVVKGKYPNYEELCTESYKIADSAFYTWSPWKEKMLDGSTVVWDASKEYYRSYQGGRYYLEIQ
ncbi:hypothetical protein FOZ62_028203 [Perkinsus olseni]|uniref:Uncharacterized protein n=1 Tax=Perkinsus olseni TaxID=32597 RepID=A0A7J6S5F0_PEROL|nr:hypothetical protein FOZ62_028203 [Perkinsus olseni]